MNIVWLEKFAKKYILQIWQIISWLRNIFSEITNHPRVLTFGSLVIFFIALFIMSKELNKFAIDDLLNSFSGLKLSESFFAAIAAFISFIALSYNDRYCLRMIDKSLPRYRTMRASITSYALAKTLGYSWAIASTARAKLYSKWGLSKGEVGALSFATGVSVQIASLLVASIGLLIGAFEIASHNNISVFFWILLSLIIALIPIGYFIYLKSDIKGFNWGDTYLKKLDLRSSLEHIGITALDKIGAAMCLYMLLPNHGSWGFPAFVAIFILAGILGAISGAPGGFGVFEAAILAMAPNNSNIPDAAVALVVYRLIYNIIPLLIGTIIIGLDHAAPVTRPAANVVKRIGSKAYDFIPQFIAVLNFVAGFVIIAATATPAFTGRFIKLEAVFPNEIMEISHFLCAIFGMLVLLNCQNIFKETKLGLKFSIFLLSISASLLLLKGIAWEVATIVGIILVLTIASRDEYEDIKLTKLSSRWLAAIIGTMAFIIFISYFVYKLPISYSILMQTGADADLSRSLRALIGASLCLLICIFLTWLFEKNKTKSEI